MFTTRLPLVATLVFVFCASLCLGQTSYTVVATIDVEQAIFESKEGKHRMATIHTKVESERKEQQGQIGTDILKRMAPIIDKFAAENGVGIIIETSTQLRDPIFWTEQRGGNVLRKQVDITKQMIDALNGHSVYLPPVKGDQNVLVINTERAVFETDEGKRELAAIGSNVTPEQKQRLSKSILDKMTPLIVKVAGDRGADIVVESSLQWPKGSVLWFAQRLDITEQVVSAYNRR